MAPHSIVEPLAMAKKRARSFTPTFPDDSSIFNGMDNAARDSLTTTTDVDVCVNEIRKSWILACRVRLDVEVGWSLSSFLRCDALFPEPQNLLSEDHDYTLQMPVQVEWQCQKTKQGSVGATKC